MTSAPPKIENLAELIEPNLDGAKLVSYTSRYLTKPGDNYGSIMLAIAAHIKKPNGTIENLELVAKMPPLNEIYWKLFQPERSCPTENSIYLSVAPALEKFQLDAKVPKTEWLDVFTKCYGARLSLDLNCKTIRVDKNALLVLENLIAKGYKLVSREEGFDLKHSVVVLKNLAKFHALPIAYQRAYPTDYNVNIFKYLKRFNINDNMDKDEYQNLIEGSIMEIKKIPEIYSEELIEQIRKLIDVHVKYMANIEECPDGPFNTISHYDFWVNNMMFLYDEKKEPTRIKIVDYQISQYESLAHDLIFMLFTSVKTSILEEKYEELLELYYNEFIASLKLVGCPTNEYSLEKFLDEIKRIAVVQFAHIFFMLKVVFMKKEAMPDDFADLKLDLMAQDNAFDETYYNKVKDFITLYKKFGYL